MKETPSKSIRLVGYCLVVLIACLSTLRLHAQVYNGTISIPDEGIEKDVQEAVSDMAFWLEKVNGKSLTINAKAAPENGYGIVLQFEKDARLASGVSKQLSQDGQSFYLIINGDRSATIVGTGSNSFINGIYTFLHELGFRWYMPGDNWTIVPQRHNFRNKNLAKLYRPAFQNRSYGGTGGMAAVKEIDPSNTFRTDFITWNRRNRLNSDYAMTGHMGRSFYTANKEVLDAHPEFFCNNKVTRSGRLNIANPKAVDLFTEWALKQVKPNNRFSVMGVEPADGREGDCLPEGMPQITTWSDKYFWLANEVASRAEAKNVEGLVVLYAYAAHAAPPGFDLHRNVYPIIIPEGFHNVAEPRQFVEMWHKKMKGRPMGIYDYWNITQWSVDRPQFNIFTIPEKLRFWKQNNVTTINLESTNAKGPMGPALWLTSQMMWNTAMSFDSLYHQFLKDCFGPAAPDVKRIYDRWSLNYQGGMDVFLSLEDLSAATLKASDPKIRNRIAELKAYILYLKRLYDYEAAPTVTNYETLINHVYSIHHMRLLQTFPLLTYYINPPRGVDKKAARQAFINKAQSLMPLSMDSIERQVKQVLAEAPYQYSFSTLKFDIAKAKPAIDSLRGLRHPRFLNGENQYRFQFPLRRKLIIEVGCTKPTKLFITDALGKMWLQKTIDSSKVGFETVSIDLPAGEYTLGFGELYRFSRIKFPPDIVFFSRTHWYDNAGYPLIYVYVPKDVTEIVYADRLGPGLNKRGNWIDPSGRVIKPVALKFGAYRVPVPPEHRGAVWILNIGHRHFKMLNIPDIWSLNKFRYQE